MIQLHEQRKLLTSWQQSILRCTVSLILVLLTQFALSFVPRFFFASPSLIQLALSVLVLLVTVGFGRWFRRLLGVYASAPAFVFFNILFIWSVYIAVIREAVPSSIHGLFNIEVVMIVIGLRSILSRDPGIVAFESPSSEKLVESSVFGVEHDNEVACWFILMLSFGHIGPIIVYGWICSMNLANSLSLRRIRYCKSCKAYIKGFDHHCPAFGNCIGQNNYFLFMVLLLGFLTTEVFYVVCSAQFVRKSQNFDRNWLENTLVGNLAISTMLFSILQVLWQGVFLSWHIYCVCFNIRTDEWVNWKKYPEFQLEQPDPGESFTRMSFRNPYDKGILQNVKDFLSLRTLQY